MSRESPLPDETTRVLLAGATGYIGRAVAAQLVEDGYEVLALVRDPQATLPGCKVVATQLTDADALSRALADEPFDAVISCIASRTGTSTDAWQVDCEANRNLLAAATTAGATHFVLLSAICVQRPLLAFQRAKLAFEADLAQSTLHYSIVRPTAFFKSLSGQIKRVRSGKAFLLFGDGTQTACKPISEQDLARFMVDCLTDPTKQDRVLPIGGPGAAITPREQGELLFELTGKPPKFRQVPAGMFTAALTILSPLSKVFGGLAAKAELARIGHYYATESMLVWDEQRQRYDADATPATGKTTLRDHYQLVLREGLAGHEALDQKLF